jgi:mitochondrial fission protein ELM1
MDEHEALMSRLLQRPSLKEERYKDYWGSLKSLGAWGGDFFMATSERTPEETRAYFQAKGHSVILSFQDLFGRDAALTLH